MSIEGRNLSVNALFLPLPITLNYGWRKAREVQHPRPTAGVGSQGNARPVLDVLIFGTRRACENE